MHHFEEPGELPEAYVMCTQGPRHIGQAGQSQTEMHWNTLTAAQLAKYHTQSLDLI